MINLGNSKLIDRRLSFVLEELRSDEPKLDQAIGLILRVLSNYASVNFDAGSFRIKCANSRMSVKAHALRINLENDKDWASKTINEHPYPLKDMWRNWLSQGNDISKNIIWNDLIKHPMITITKEEDELLRKIDRVNENIFDRYTLAKIHVR